MSSNKNETNILRLIKYVPPLLILIFSIILISYVAYDYQLDFELRKKETKNQFIESKKEVLKTNIDETVSKYIANELKGSRQKLEKKLKKETYSAHKIMSTLYEDLKDKMSKEEITKIIKNTIRPIRFNQGRGYFYIVDFNGVNILNAGKPSIEGKNILKIKDIKGNYLVKDSLSIAKSEKAEGFKTFWFNKPNDKLTEYEKLGFVKKFEPFNWYIGTGEYLKDFENEIKDRLLEYLNTTKYEGNQYIFVFNKKGNFLVAENEKQLGKNIFEVDETAAKKMKIDEFLNSNLESKFVQYKVVNNVKENNYNKITYLKKFEPLGWVVALGFNLDNVNSMIEVSHLNLKKRYNQNLNTLYVISVIITILFLIVSHYISNKIGKKFIKHKQDLEQKYNIDKMYKSILSLASDGIHILDSKGNVVQCSQSFASNLGYTVDEALKLNIKDWCNNEDIKNVDTFLKNITHDSKLFETKHKKKDGTVFDVQINSKIVELSGKKFFYASQRDISDIKEKDKQLFENQRLASLGEMLGNIAHQWRQPLSVISSSATGMILQKQFNKLTDELFEKSCNNINNNAQFLSRTIDDFRNFIKGDSKSVLFNLKNDTDKFIKLVNTSISKYNIKVILELEEHIEINGYPNELIQCFMNLFNNSKDAFLEKNIAEEDRYIFITQHIIEDKVIITFKDSAKGISEDIIPKIFEPYFTTKHQSQGTGLGLSMTYKLIVEGMYGTIKTYNVEYTYNNKHLKGAEFEITLPI